MSVTFKGVYEMSLGGFPCIRGFATLRDIAWTFLAMARDATPRPGKVDLNELQAGALEFVAYDLRNAKIAVTICIEDIGPSIPAEDQARAFEPFFTTKAFGDSGGSGLALAKGIFESHGGAIIIDPATRTGCALIVTLPATKGETA